MSDAGDAHSVSSREPVYSEERQGEYHAIVQQLVHAVFAGGSTLAGVAHGVAGESDTVFSTTGRPLTTVMQRLAHEVIASRPSSSRRALWAIPDGAHLGAVCASLRVYLSLLLAPVHRRRLAQTMSGTACEWLRSLLHVATASDGRIAPSLTAARLAALRAAIASRRPASADTPWKPVVYASKPHVAQLTELLPRLGLFTNILVRGVAPLSESRAFDVDALCQAVQQDVAAGATPCFVYSSESATGAIDDLPALRRACTDLGVWLHVEGMFLALLLAQPDADSDVADVAGSASADSALSADEGMAAARAIRSALATAVQADSLAVQPGPWYGVPDHATAVFFRVPPPSDLPSVVLDADADETCALPLWVFMQCIGADAMRQCVRLSLAIGAVMRDQLATLPYITMQDSRVAASAWKLLFRYTPPSPCDSIDVDTAAVSELIKAVRARLHHPCQRLGIDLVSVAGVAHFRFEPVARAPCLAASAADVANFVDALRYELDGVESTLAHASQFAEFVRAGSAVTGLDIVSVASFIGLGAVRYVPTYLRSVDGAPGPGTEADIAKLNEALADTLSMRDTLFARGEDRDGNVCVLVGCTRDPMTRQHAQELVAVIAEAAGKLDAQREVLANLGHMVREQIARAETELAHQRDQAAYEDGIVRQLPLVGRVVNWFAPPEAPVRRTSGRAFDLGSRSLQSSDVVLSRSSFAQSRSRSNDMLSEIGSVSGRVASDASPSSRRDDRHTDTGDAKRGAGHVNGTDPGPRHDAEGDQASGDDTPSHAGDQASGDAAADTAGDQASGDAAADAAGDQASGDDTTSHADVSDSDDTGVVVRSDAAGSTPSGRKTISWDEVAQHANEADLWIVIDGKVYDVTAWVEDHPGGAEPLLEHGGQDASEAFHEIGHSPSAIADLKEYYLADVIDDLA